MNWNIIQGSWTQLKGKAKAQWGRLSGDVITEKDDAVVSKIREAYGFAKDGAEPQTERFNERNKD